MKSSFWPGWRSLAILKQACCLLLLCLPVQLQAQQDLPVDKVLVVKSERQMYLLHRDQVLKSYQVSLGQKTGPKRHEGDLRTPEGLYWLDWRKPSERYNLAINISYPNAQDIERASRAGKSPGNMIMIHGTPIDDEIPEWFFSSLNWTEGCIALTNQDMQEVWRLVSDNTLIEIRP